MIFHNFKAINSFKLYLKEIMVIIKWLDFIFVNIWQMDEIFVTDCKFNVMVNIYPN